MNGSRARVVVEIVGAPGSGKTTLANRLLEVLQEANHSVCQSRRIERSNVSPQSRVTAGVRTIVDVIKLWPYLYRSYSGGTALKDVGWGTVRRRVWRHAYARRLGDEAPSARILIVEPGWQMQLLNGYLFSQALLSPTEAADFLKQVPASDLSICLFVEPAIAIGRLKQRPRGLPQRMRQLKDDRWQGVIERGNSSAKVLAEQGRALGRAVVELDVSELPPEAVLQNVQDAVLAAFLGQTPQQANVDEGVGSATRG